MKKHLLSLALLTCGIAATAQTGNVGIGTSTPGSKLTVNGSFGATYNKQTGTTYTLTATDYYVAGENAANSTFTLPSVATASPGIQGRVYNIKNTGTGTMTLQGTGSEKLDNQSGPPVANISIPAGYYALVVATGVTTVSSTTAQWEVAITGNSNAGCVPGYMLAGMSNNPSITGATDVVFNTVAGSSGITLNTSTGVFTLTAGNTYMLQGAMRVSLNGSTASTAYLNSSWVNAATNAALPGSNSDNIGTTYSNSPESQQGTAVSIYTPTTNVTVKLRVTGVNGTNAQLIGDRSYALIQQLNPCGGSGGSIAGTPDYDWVRQSDGQVPTNPTDIAVPISHGGAANQDVLTSSTLSESGIGNYSQYSLQLGSTSSPIKGNLFANYSGDGRTVGLQSQSADPVVIRTTTTSAVLPVERMRVTPAGNVGVGTTNPVSHLSVVSDGAGGGTADDIELASYNSSGPSAAFYFKSAAGTQASPTNITNGTSLGQVTFQGQINGSMTASSYLTSNYLGSGTTNLSNMLFATSATERMRIDQNGYVGVGTTTPISILANTSVNTVASDGLGISASRSLTWSSNQGGYTACFTNTQNTLNYGGVSVQVAANDATGALDVSRNTNPNAAGTPLFRVQGNGYVGIGTNSPQAPLHVASTTGNSFTTGAGYYFFSGAGTASYGAQSTRNDISIFAAGNVWSTGAFLAASSLTFSDARIKNITGLSNSAADLATLSKLRITDYTMKDKVQWGDKQFKKVIAQEVEKVYPQAVTTVSNYIPDVFVLATSVKAQGSTVTITTPKAHGFKAGDMVKLYTKENKEVIVKVAAVPSQAEFTVQIASPEAQYFVYGKQVSDFRSVDYEALSTLNISATQELAKQLAAAKAEIDALKAQAAEVAELKTALAEMRAELSKVVVKKAAGKNTAKK